MSKDNKLEEAANEEEILKIIESHSNNLTEENTVVDDFSYQALAKDIVNKFNEWQTSQSSVPVVAGVRWVNAGKELPKEWAPKSLLTKKLRRYDTEEEINHSDIVKVYADAIELKSDKVMGKMIYFNDLEWQDESPLSDKVGEEEKKVISDREIRELAIEHWDNVKEATPTWLLPNEITAKENFIAGYKAAQTKPPVSVEGDLSELIKYIDAEILLNKFYEKSPQLRMGASMVKIKAQELLNTPAAG